jgi:hypothetical protein
VLNSADYTLAEKQSLLIGYVQCGIDLFGQYVEGSHGNPPNGGIFTGMMLPMLAFGRAFNYQPVGTCLPRRVIIVTAQSPILTL